MIGDAVAFDEEISLVALAGDRLQVNEGLEGLRDVGGLNPLGLRVGREQDPGGDGRRGLLLNSGLVVTLVTVPRMGQRRV